MIEFEAKIKGIAVRVIPGCYNFKLIKTDYRTVLSCFFKTGNESNSHSNQILGLPKDNEYEIIGLTSDILKSEELADKVVETVVISKTQIAYRNYLSLSGWYDDSCRSFQSLLEVYSIDNENLILRRV